VNGLLQDVRLAFRSLRATPVVSIAAALSLALGIGANTTIFSLINSLLLRPLPVRSPEQLVSVSTGPQQSQRVFSFATWDTMRGTDTFENALAYAPPSRLRVTIGREAEMLRALWLSGGAFRTLGVPAVLGRVYTAQDDVQGGGPDGPVAVISYRMWQRRYGGSPAVVGTPITIEHLPFTIVGVTPPDFYGFEVGRDFDVALPVYAQPLVRGAGGITRDQPWMRVVLRLNPGQSIGAATDAARADQPRIRENSLPQPVEWRPGFLADPFVLEAAGSGTSALGSQYRRPLVTLFGLTALVLFIACANIANLALARGLARRPEMSLRHALGASRARLLRQLFVENALLAAIGGTGGLAFAAWARPALVGRLSTDIAEVALDLSLDSRELGFTAVVMLASVVVCGLVPGLRSSRTASVESIKGHGHKAAARTALSSSLVVGQVGVSVTLVMAVGLFVQTIERLAHVDLGFDRDRVLVVGVDAARATLVEADRTAFYHRLIEAVRAVPGVSDAGGSLSTPMGDAPDFPIIVTVPGVESILAAERAVELNGITTGWRAAYGVSMVSGRDVEEHDRADGQPVMVVNEAFVRRFLADTDPVGVSVTLAAGSSGEIPIGAKTIVGVIGDMAWRSVRLRTEPAMFIPVTQWPSPLHPTTIFSISVRSETTSPALLTQDVTTALLALDRNLVLRARPLADQVGASFMQERLVAQLSGFFSGLGLLLAGLGLYGVTWHWISVRRAEIGIRVAVGAAPVQVIRLVMSRVALLLSIGVIAGIVASLWLSKFVVTLLYGIEPYDWATLLTAMLILGVVGGVAGWLPARRASQIDPSEVLRST
jgi:putative ABC transport system permease protein